MLFVLILWSLCANVNFCLLPARKVERRAKGGFEINGTLLREQSTIEQAIGEEELEQFLQLAQVRKELNGF